MIFKLLIAVISIFILSTTNGLADKNICEIAQQLVMATEIGAKEIYNRDINGGLFSGTGFINDIKGDPKDTYLKYYISCANDVIIMFEARNYSTANFKVGQQLSFSGRCASMKKGVYKNTGGRYVLLGFQNTSIK